MAELGVGNCQKLKNPIYVSPPLVSELLRSLSMKGRFLVHMKFTPHVHVNIL